MWGGQIMMRRWKGDGGWKSGKNLEKIEMVVFPAEYEDGDAPAGKGAAAMNGDGPPTV